MNYKKVVYDSWQLVQDHTYLQWFAALPMMAMIFVDALYMPARWGNKIVDNFWGEAREFVINFYNEHNSLFMIVAIVFALSFLIYIFLNAFFEGGLIGMINRIIQNNNQPIRSSLGFGYGAKTFGRLLKLHAITALMNPVIIYILMSVLHDYEQAIYDLLFWPLFVVLIVNVFLKLGISYSDYETVIHKTPVLKSIKNSFSIVIFNLKETIFIALIVGLILLRAILNLLLIFIVPAFLIWISTKIIGIGLSTLAIALIVLMSLFIYYYMVKFASMFEVFITAIWIFSYHELSRTTQEHLEAISG